MEQINTTSSSNALSLIKNWTTLEIIDVCIPC